MPKPPAWLARLPRPAFMAVGDSLINGMRAYSITDQMALTSIPARLGASLKPMEGFAPFIPARYPEPLLFDAEALAAEARLLRPLPMVVIDALDDVHANALRWLRGEHPPAEVPQFDNLAAAGAVAPDVFDVTLGALKARLAAMRPVVEKTAFVARWKGGLPDGTSWGLGDLHIALNQARLMDPMGKGGLDAFTVMDIVEARRPRMLMVGVGPNHGLVSITAAGAGEAGLESLREFARGWGRHAKRIARLDGVEVVILGLMPLPSQVPGLMPYSREHEGVMVDVPATPGAYFEHYVSALSVPVLGFGASYPGAVVKALDEGVEGVRQDVISITRAALKGSGKTLVLMDFAAIIGAHDHKHLKGPMIGPGPGLRQGYCNRSLADMRLLPGRSLRGGICSLDGHHPTAMGYAHAAEAVRRALPAAIASTPIRVSDEDDPTLTDPPWSALRTLQALRPMPPVPGGLFGEAGGPGAENNFVDLVLGRGLLRG